MTTTTTRAVQEYINFFNNKKSNKKSKTQSNQQDNLVLQSNKIAGQYFTSFMQKAFCQSIKQSNNQPFSHSAICALSRLFSKCSDLSASDFPFASRSSRKISQIFRKIYGKTQRKGGFATGHNCRAAAHQGQRLRSTMTCSSFSSIDHY